MKVIRMTFAFCCIFYMQQMKAQLPILYYDFESNTSRTTFQNVVEQSINTGNSIISKFGVNPITAAAGAGLSYTGGAASGQSISASEWSNASSNPGIAAASYFQFTANTSGFSGLSLDLDCYPGSILNLGILITAPRNIGVLYSVDGGTTFVATTVKSTGTLDTWNHISFDLSSITAINNQSAVIFRIYGYKANSVSLGVTISEVLRMDNLQLNALSTVANAGTLTLLDEAGIYTSTTSGATGSVFTRQYFTVNGTSTTVNMGQCTFRGVGTVAGALTVQNNAVLNMTSSVIIDSAIVATSTPLSTLTINTGGTVNLSGTGINLMCKGTTNVSSTGTLNCGTNTVTNTGTFVLSTDGTIGIGSTQGIAATGATGNIQTGTRTFGTGGNYLYNGTTSQATGTGLPSTVGGLLINNASTLMLTNDVAVTTQAVLTTGTVSIGSKTLSLNGTVTTTSGNLSGTNSSTLSIGGSSSQNITFKAGSSLGTLNVNKSGGTATLNSPLDIYTGISFNSANTGTLNLNGQHVTLKSSSAKTAYVGRLYGSLTNATNVTVERYVPGHRSWRLMSVPLSSAGAPTINAAWQEGVTTASSIPNPYPGFGTHITGGATTGGFDRNSLNNPSMYFLDTITGQFKGVSNTNATAVTAYPGYLLFVRGSRANNLNLLTYASTDNTILRPTGALKTGTQTVSSAAAGFRIVGNPFASSINFTTLTKNNVPDYYYVWDPLLTGSNGVGAFVTLVNIGAGYLAIPNPVSPIDLNGSIQSGAAFVVYFTAPGSLQIKESDKTTGSAVVFKPESGNANSLKVLRCELSSYNADTTISLVDGTLALFNNDFSNTVDNMDIIKMTNVAEGVGILRGGRQLAIEKRQEPGMTDTIYLKMSQLKQKQYKFVITNEQLNRPGLIALLEDKYLNTQTVLDLNGTVSLDFTVTSNAASSAADRFKIVFTQGATLPVKVTDLYATVLQENITVKWQVENQLNIKQYEIERSSNGADFVKVGSVKAVAGATAYNWTDIKATNGIRYYRIKSISDNSEVDYTAAVKVAFTELEIKNGITIYPNPLTDNNINLQFNNQVKGVYTVKILNNAGQAVYTESLKDIQGNNLATIALPQNITRGAYQLEIVKPNKTRSISKIVY